jgi:hypothetical protein
LTAAVAVAAFACPCALAQENAVPIEDRIDAVFDLVPRNALELAVPLSRRALLERSAEEEADGALFFQQPEAPPTAAVQEDVAPPREVEEGSAEDADMDMARLPRPRPLAPSGGEVGSPLDLVAGSALPVPSAPPPSDEPQQLLPPPSPELVAAADRAAAALAATAAPIVEVAATSPAAPSGPDLVPPPTEITASGACLSISEVADEDGDFRRHAEALATPGFCIEEEKFRERRRPWMIQTVASGRPGPLWVVMHDDEDVAFDNAVYALTTYGGILVAMETGGERNQDGVDPNRNFSDDNVGCAKLGNSAAPEFSGIFKELFGLAQPIIALHNNHEAPIPTGGVGHVTISSPPRGMQVLESSDPDSPLADDHTLVLIASGDPRPGAVTARANSLAAKGINVILEPVREGRGDCSLSNYAVLSGYPSYFNVTVDHDGGDKQRRIVDLLMGSFGGVAASL